ncbi:MAG: nuclear transport factor 2 family protein [Candidatus Acidiferrum sp.]
MNRKFIVLCVTALLISGLSGQFLSGNTGAIEKEIRTLEDTMNDAYARNDLPRYFSYYATDFVQWLPEGRTDLAKYERDWTDYIAAGNKVQAIEIRQMIVKVDAAEDTAVASYILYVKTKLADGKITEEENQETDIWFKRNGNWKIVALHYSPAAKK